MNNILWKKFKIGDLFEQSQEHYLEKSKKNYDISEVKTDEYPVAVVSASGKNNGIVGYIAEIDDVPVKKRKGYITKGGFGHFFYQDDWFIKPGGSWGMLDIVKFKNDKLKQLFDNNKIAYYWITKMLTKVFVPMCSYSFSPKFENEVILLPCIECDKEEAIWEDKYTLAVEYIEQLMSRAKDRREANTIKKYEAERKKYEAERKKYEAEYFAEKPLISWKKFKLGDLFDFDDAKRLSKPIKAYNTQNEPADDYIPNVTASGKNNGIANYIQISEETHKLKQKDAFTLSGVAGICFYHDDEFVMTSNVALLIAKDNKLKNIIKSNKICSTYIANTITRAFTGTGVYSWAFGINAAKFNREIIMLPCVECSKEEAIWEDKYTLAVKYIESLMKRAEELYFVRKYCA